jgi:hypothetical protein
MVSARDKEKASDEQKKRVITNKRVTKKKASTRGHIYYKRTHELQEDTYMIMITFIHSKRTHIYNTTTGLAPLHCQGGTYGHRFSKRTHI